MTCKSCPGSRDNAGIRDVSGRFLKGTSGNPLGKPKGGAGLAERCRKATRDGATLVRLMVGIITGDEPTATVADKIKAATWLADRAFGKPLQVIEETVDLDLREFNDAELSRLIRGETVGEVTAAMQMRRAGEELAAALGVKPEELLGPWLEERATAETVTPEKGTPAIHG